MPEPQPTIEYTVRRNAFEKQRVWRVDDSGLSWTYDGRGGHFDFSEITSIRLEWAASRADHARYACYVVRFNGWTETIVSTHYAGPMQFPDRRETYRPFIVELILRTAKANPACTFHAGATLLSYAGSFLILGTSLVLLAAVALSLGVPFTWLIIAKLIILAFLVPLGLAWLWKNRPRRFTPPDVPPDVLPPTVTSSLTEV
jgi:hypothetical protein